MALLVDKDGGVWESSYNPDNPFVGLFNRDKQYFFRRLRKRRWWFGYARTGETWEGGDTGFRERGFKLIKAAEERRK